MKEETEAVVGAEIRTAIESLTNTVEHVALLLTTALFMQSGEARQDAMEQALKLSQSLRDRTDVI
jgi:erythromycin esterase-like protein